jgi:hypothetical protein
MGPEPAPDDDDVDDVRERIESSFEVMDAEQEGPRCPNTVTPEELESVAEMYWKLEESKACVSTSGLSGDAQDGTMADYLEILRTGIGRDLVGELLSDPEGHQVIHQPLVGGGDGASPQDMAAAHGQSDKGGSNSRVLYDPGEDHEYPGQGQAPAWYPWPSHVTLFHVLVHAHHHTEGTALFTPPEERTNPKGRDRDFRYDEELATTGVHPDGLGDYTENAYRSERRALGEELPERESYYPQGYFGEE